MTNILIGIGIVISLYSLLAIFLTGNKKKKVIKNHSTKNNINKGELELEFFDLKNQIVDLTMEFNRTANFNTDTLDKKIMTISELNLNLDEKIVKSTKLITDMDILYRRLLEAEVNLSEKLKNISNAEEKILRIKPKTKPMIRNTIGYEDEIVEYYKRGLDIYEIAEKMGKSMGEIEFVLGLKRMR
ncbi:hypothetical protein [Haliovirga abyssi]|uniref:DUF2802 domain-containing protein n=1 Tax=Haliovirga abyssi TaxID=2996794 RepID=A0AAU9DWD8_9FUSO|nr:hypothetical protein [Haliovirga abyssi]BDU50581.1 hypothetical protein HLVA_11500 [Haliovirga abyssi]